MYRNRVATLSVSAPVTRALAAGLVLTVLAALSACGAGGAPTTVNAPPPTNTGQSYTGPPPANADVQAFMINLWANISPANRCGGCHHAGGQSPMFARSDDVNLAYQAALPLVNLSNPAQSTMVLKVGGGHNCWVADPSACAATLLVWIQGWIGAGSSSTTSVKLTAPPVRMPGNSLQFPVDPNTAGTNGKSFANTVYPLLATYCVGCHTSSSASAQQPYFASANIQEAYLAAQPKMSLATAAANPDPGPPYQDQSRFYERLANESHHCWGSPPDCVASSNAMHAAIRAFALGITPTQVDPSLIVSNALALTDGIIAAGGSRYETNLVAKYMFETGQGSTAYDTSGVTPEADLSLSGNVTWVGGWGINIGAGGKAQASTSASAKFAGMIQPAGEYTIETWVAPADVTQTNAWIVSYSGSNTTRNMTLGQAAMQYQGFARSSATSTAGTPALLTTTTGGAAQAALQHVVLTYDAVNGQKIYVNGVYTGDVDQSKGGSLANWDSTFALVLGNETTGQRQWRGVIKFVAIHNRALTPAQIQQNFAAGVGQKFFLLFGVSQLTGVNQSYILFQGSQYDTYTYLFAQPKFISLDSSAMPANLPISGMRIGVNGVLAPAGQAYTSVNATIGGSNYTAASGQLLSPLGTVVPATLGPANDLFFLSFDQIGTHVHAYVDPTPPGTPPALPTTPQPDFGVATFERYNHSLSRITGVAITDSVVNSLYQASQQSMPSGPLIAAFGSAQQTAFSQLASAYCGEMMASTALRDAFFGGTNPNGLDTAIGNNTSAATFFGSSGSATRTMVINALVNNAVGNANPQVQLAVRNEVDALLTKIPTVTAANVQHATTAACTAVLGSAAVTLQ
ncbi:MAG: LamG domain-containing protein [Gammaproteobacteria bacterium]|nr:LamG domain-containing protein [Gammaproteobacteria bacterium]